MPINSTTAYNNALSSTIKEEWIFELRNDTYTSGGSTQYIRLGTAEVGSGTTKYHSLITSLPSIRETIDLKASTSKNGNLSISCVNGQLSNYSNATLAEEIYGGTRKYINRDVIVKSRVGGQENTIYTGRLKSVKLQNQDVVSIEIAAKTPIDFLKIPEFTSKAGNFFPIVYGDGVSETSTISYPGFIDNARCFPLQVDSLNDDRFNCLAFEGFSLGSATDTGFDTDGIGPQSLLADVTDNTFQIINGSVPTAFEVGKIIQIDSEKMLITASAFVPATFVEITVVRAYAGTTLAAHADGADVYSVAISSGIDDGKLHYPIKDMFDANGFPLFTPILTGNDEYAQENSTNLYEGSENDDKPILFAPINLKRGYYIRSQTVEASSGYNATSNLANAYDTSASSFATLTHSADDDFTVQASFLLKNLPREEHSIKKCNLKFSYQVSAFDQPTGGGETLSTKYRVFINENYDGGENVDGTDHTSTTTVQNASIDLLDTTDFPSNTSRVPESISLRFFASSNGNIGQGSGDTHGLTIKVFDMYLEINSEIDAENTDKDVQNLVDSSAVTSVKKLYTPADGLDQSWAAGTRVSNIAQMHRDLIYRFAGITTEPENYSALNTARTNWTIFYYLHKQQELLKVLKQCQKEGGFIFRFKASDGSPQYIYLVDSPATDHTISKSDITNTSISLTAFDSLVTKRVIKYQRNPINDELLFEQTSTDTTNNPRTDYNVQSDENVETEELKILNGAIGAVNMGSGNKNDGYANYYNSIEGNPKLLIDTEIINPGSSGGSSYFYLMEVGDICAFDHTDMIVEPFGESFNGKKFIVTGLTRSLGSLKVTLREI